MDELNKIIDRYTEGNYLIGKTAKEEMAKDILALFSVSESNSPIEVETMDVKLFTLANELAVNGYGNAAVKMHSIHNGMITKGHYYSR